MKMIDAAILAADKENRLKEDFFLSDLSVDAERLIDPFSKEEFFIFRSPELKSEDKDYVCHLFGVGPDKTFEYQVSPLRYTVYDSTNGSKSAGDIVQIVVREN